ncbi:hypothetical protein BH10PLA2_BH10PLA2_12860 [soil metagenome]
MSPSQHDIAQAAAVALVETIEPLLFGFEKRIAFDEFYAIVMAGLERQEAELRSVVKVIPSAN